MVKAVPGSVQLGGGNGSFYRFAHNDPVGSVDPLGLSELIIPRNLYEVKTPGGPKIVALPAEPNVPEILGQLELVPTTTNETATNKISMKSWIGTHWISTSRSSSACSCARMMLASARPR